jgi:hypothetical protein
MERENRLLCLQKHVTGLYPKQDKFVQHLHIPFFKIRFNIILKCGRK